MKVSPKIIVRSLCLVLVVALASVVASAQQSATGSLRGQIMDEFGGVIVGATVTALDASGKERTATTDNDGNFTIAGLAPGKYILRAVAPGFALYESADVDVVPGRAAPLKITLGVSLGKEEVTVASEGPINVDANSAGAIVLKGKDLEALPDDPDELAAALQALAGPAAGPNGGQILIDGFEVPRSRAQRDGRQRPRQRNRARPGDTSARLLQHGCADAAAPLQPQPAR